MSNKESTFSAKGLIKAYSGRKVVNNVSLRLAQGQIVTFGPKWSGKTTSFYMMVAPFVQMKGKLF